MSLAIRVKPGCATFAGLTRWESDARDLVVPVVAVRPAYSREDAERDGFIRGETQAEEEINHLRRLRRHPDFVGMDEAGWRRFLRELAPRRYAVYADLEEWATPPRPLGEQPEVTIDVAEWLVDRELAEWVEPDLSGLEDELAALADEP